MIKRTIEISREPAHLAASLEQLLIRRGEQTVSSIPCEDIGVVLVDHPGATYSHAALTTLADFNAVLVVCGPNHLPAAMLLPIAQHTEVVWRFADQVNAAKALKKRLWKEIIQAKIRAQARNLPAETPARSKLLDLARQVRAGDPANLEAQAAKIYWEHWRPDPGFRRDCDGGGLNALLNYGYAVLRAAVARAVVAAGLLPALGLFHANRSDSFCLADDLMEPLRPLVDRRARALYQQGHDDLNAEAKAALLEILTDRVQTGEEAGPLMVHLHAMVASLIRCFRGEAKRLEIPRVCS